MNGVGKVFTALTMGMMLGGNVRTMLTPDLEPPTVRRHPKPSNGYPAGCHKARPSKRWKHQR